MKAGKAHEQVRIKKALPLCGGETLAAGSEITLTEDWEPIPPMDQGRVIIDPQGERRLVREDDLEYSLGAH